MAKAKAVGGGKGKASAGGDARTGQGKESKKPKSVRRNRRDRRRHLQKSNGEGPMATPDHALFFVDLEPSKALEGPSGSKEDEAQAEAEESADDSASSSSSSGSSSESDASEDEDDATPALLGPAKPPDADLLSKLASLEQEADGPDERRGEQRYFKEERPGTICGSCGEEGHTRKECEHTLCLTCGVLDEHETRDCPISLVCWACGSRGHVARQCPNSGPGISRVCVRCRATTHRGENCPSIWRQYEEAPSSWPRTSKSKIIRACYNCASTDDHFGDQCPFPRPRRAQEPSAFTSRPLLPSLLRDDPPPSRPRNDPGPPRYRDRDAYDDRRDRYDDRRRPRQEEPEEDDDWFSRGADARKRPRVEFGKGKGSLLDRLGPSMSREADSRSRRRSRSPPTGPCADRRRPPPREHDALDYYPRDDYYRDSPRHGRGGSSRYPSDYPPPLPSGPPPPLPPAMDYRSGGRDGQWHDWSEPPPSRSMGGPRGVAPPRGPAMRSGQGGGPRYRGGYM